MARSNDFRFSFFFNLFILTISPSDCFSKASTNSTVLASTGFESPYPQLLPKGYSEENFIFVTMTKMKFSSLQLYYIGIPSV